MAPSNTDGPNRVGEASEANEANDTGQPPAAINGTGYIASRPYTPPGTGTTLPRTPSLTSFSLTEYSAKPSPPSEDRKVHLKKIVPDHLLLPNGNPDVSHPRRPSSPLASAPRYSKLPRGASYVFKP